MFLYSCLDLEETKLAFSKHFGEELDRYKQQVLVPGASVFVKSRELSPLLYFVTEQYSLGTNFHLQRSPSYDGYAGVELEEVHGQNSS